MADVHRLVDKRAPKLTECAPCQPLILGQEFVEETKKSSGLDEKALGNQPGNDPSPTFGTTEIKTPKGQEAAGLPSQTLILASYLKDLAVTAI